MTCADIILIFIGIIGLLISFGTLVIAFLTFLDKNALPVCQQVRRRS